MLKGKDKTFRQKKNPQKLSNTRETKYDIYGTYKNNGGKGQWNYITKNWQEKNLSSKAFIYNKTLPKINNLDREFIVSQPLITEGTKGSSLC